MPEQTQTVAETEQATSERPEQAPVEQDVLVEEVSIDGMCGVY